MNLIEKRSNLVILILLIIFALIGSYFRLMDLTFAAIGVDEFYSIKSIQNILEKGIPAFADGGLYMRGIFYQYLIALLVKSGLQIEFASRLIPAIFNILTIPAIYLIAKKFLPKLPTLFVVFLFSFSVWEIEVSRFARMYTPFQFIFFWYLYNFIQYLIENKKKSVKWIYILSFISPFVYEGGIFLLTLNFIPFFWNKRINFGHFFISIVIFGFGFIYLKTDFLHLNVPESLPNDLLNQATNSTPIVIPNLLILSFSLLSIWSVFYGIIIIAIGFIYFKFLKSNELDFTEQISLFVVVLFALLNLFALCILSLVLLFFSDWISREKFISKKITLLAAAIGISFIFWTIYWFVSGGVYIGETVHSKTLIKGIIKTFFNFPEVLIYFKKFIKAIPYFTIFSTISISSLILVKIFKKTKKDKILELLLFLFLYLILISTIIKVDTFRTRYLFYLYPMMFLFIVWFLNYCSNLLKLNSTLRNIMLVLLFLAFLVIEKDFNLNHLVNINNPNENFRMIYNRNTARHFYESSFDFRDVANFLDNHKNSREILIVDQPNIAFYLNQNVNYFYADQSDDRVYNISIFKGKKERWLSSNLLYKNSDLTELLDNNKGIWFVTSSKHHKYFEQVNFYKNYKKYLKYKSKDGFSVIYYIPPTNSKS